MTIVTVRKDKRSNKIFVDNYFFAAFVLPPSASVFVLRFILLKLLGRINVHTMVLTKSVAEMHLCSSKQAIIASSASRCRPGASCE